QSEHSYLTALSKAYGDVQLNSWADLQATANEIKDKVHISDKETTAPLVLKAVFDLVRGLAGEIPVAGKAIEAANRIYEFIGTLTEIDNAGRIEPSEDSFQSSVDTAGKKLADRLMAAQNMLNVQLPNVIAADYQKLMTAGACASDVSRDTPTSVNPLGTGTGFADCPAPYDHLDWHYSSDDQIQAAKALPEQLRVSFYQALLPAKYHLYKLPQWWRTKVNGY
ncbi:MAG TPA: hypothetical protein VGH24_05650, partial [Solirubrobacteraceae bacterium]